jgi:hypothetical protein
MADNLSFIIESGWDSGGELNVNSATCGIVDGGRFDREVIISSDTG